MTPSLQKEVRLRARGLCEYCQLPEAQVEERFCVDHIIAQQHDGETASMNLALACPKCNLHKGPNIGGIDPASKSLVPLFNPREQIWSDHFAWNGPFVVGQTPVGRATIAVLTLNSPGRIGVRAGLILLGLFPPD